MSDEKRIERLSAMLKRRGIILPAFEIYGGVSGLIDYGPVGASIRRRVIQNSPGSFSFCMSLGMRATCSRYLITQMSQRKCSGK